MRIKTLFIALLALLCAPFAAGAEDSTLRLVDKEMFPAEKAVNCRACGLPGPGCNRFCGACGARLASEEINGNLYFKAGGFIPLNMFVMNTYGSAVQYGVGLNLTHKWLGVKLEFENAVLERLVPLSTVSGGVPALSDWKNATSRLSVTPVWVSAFANTTYKEWMGYFGLGAGIAMIKEEFKGEYYFKQNPSAAPDWGYASLFNQESLWGLQAFIGLVKSDRIGFDIKLMYIPSQGKFAFSDLGGVSTSINICF